MFRTKKADPASRQARLPFTTTKPCKVPKKTSSSQSSTSTEKSLQLALNQEKEAHQDTHKEIIAAKTAAKEAGGLRLKRLREENEDLTERLEDEVAKIGRLEIQLKHERQLRERRDGTTGFVSIWKNDPEIWMAEKVTITAGGGGGGGGKRKRDKGGFGRESREVVDADVLAKKKKANEEWAARRKGLVDEDDEEEVSVPFKRMKIKLEERKKEEEASATAEETCSGEIDSLDEEDPEYPLRFAEWMAAKPTKAKKTGENKVKTESTYESIITNPDPNIMDCDEEGVAEKQIKSEFTYEPIITKPSPDVLDCDELM